MPATARPGSDIPSRAGNVVLAKPMRAIG